MSPARTANPAPRRALRKADDAGIHPATTRPAPLAPVTAPGAPATVPVDTSEESPAAGQEPEPGPEKSKKRKASDGKTRDAQSATDSSPQPTRSSGSATVSGPAVWDKRFHGNTADVLQARRTTHDLLLGAEGVLEVKVPKRLRKAARLEAEGHGLTIDQVVTRLLADWLESR